MGKGGKEKLMDSVLGSLFLTKEQYEKYNRGEEISERECYGWINESIVAKTTTMSLFGESDICSKGLIGFVPSDSTGIFVGDGNATFKCRIAIMWHGRMVGYDLKKSWPMYLGRECIIKEIDNLRQEILAADYSVIDFENQLSCDVRNVVYDFYGF